MAILRMKLHSGEVLELSGEYSSNMAEFNLKELIHFNIMIENTRVVHHFKAVTIKDNIVQTNDKEAYQLGELM